MKRLRNVLCVLMVIVFSLCSTIQVSALSVNDSPDQIDYTIKAIFFENFGHMIESVIRKSEIYGIDANDFDDFTILNPVSFNCIGEVDGDSSILHFPVMDETGNICLIYDIIISNNGYSATIGTDFAPLLNAAYNAGCSSVVLIQDESSFYAINNNNAFSQSQSNVVELNAFQCNEFTESELNLSSMMPSSLTVNNELSYIAENSYVQIIQNQENVRSLAVVGTNSLNNYPIVDQVVNGTQYGLCWAATVASMVRFEKPSTYGNLTAQNVADYMNIDYDDGGTNSESQEALEYYLGNPYVPTIINDVLTQNEIKTVIDNIDPAYMQCRRPDGFLRYQYHAVALIGYDFTNNYNRIEIMDPAYACYKYCTMNSDGEWTFAFGSYTYTWIKTIRLLYSI